MRILMLDIETSPNLGWVWSLWNQNIGLSQLVVEKDILCFAAEWLDKPYKKEFHAQWGPGGKEGMLKAAHRLLDEADAVIHYNGTRFDVPHLQGEMWKAGMLPPSPHKDIDLLKTVKNKFALPSNKLAHVTATAGLATKTQTGGFELWVDVMAGDPKAQKKMQRYCENDVTIMRDLYWSLLPWLVGHPNVSLYGGQGCPRCGAEDSLEKRGVRTTSVGQYQRYRCSECGGWSSSGKALHYVDIRSE